MSTGSKVAEAHLAGLLSEMAANAPAQPSLAQVVAGTAPAAAPPAAGPPAAAPPAAAPPPVASPSPSPQQLQPALPIQVGGHGGPATVKFVISPVGPNAAETLKMYKPESRLYVPGENSHLNSGVDIAFPQAIEIPPGGVVRVPLGVRVRMLNLFWGASQFPCATPGAYWLAARSSITNPKKGRTVILANGIGLIDYGYTGELQACLINLGGVPARFEKGESVIQLVSPQASPAEFVVAPPGSEMERLTFPPDEGGRGAAGVGSTGTRGTSAASASQNAAQ